MFPIRILKLSPPSVAVFGNGAFKEVIKVKSGPMGGP